ncbi:AAA family ATPase [Paraconexibacter algicola]|uniref:ATPase n=1 Tax=Paraconexibacter algicola TaxID=2133960 RepID=A0A2T4UFF6_9ACTN|nr:AAA family ATPase [Paraconexibacter algicola]PTL56519.1 ATPase [Paraconexibacter algicola]
MSVQRLRGYLATAATAAREGRDADALAALRLAQDAARTLPATAPERAELAVARAELAQRAGDPAAAAAAFAEACEVDRAASRVDGLAVIRRLRAALATDAAGDRDRARDLADEAVRLSAGLGDALRAEARTVRDRLEGGPPPAPVRRAAPPATPAAPAPDPATVEDLLAELDGLIGLAGVKAEVRRLVALAQVAQARGAAGLPVGVRTRHLAMVGAPGTGKTTVARIVGRLYGALGVVGSGHLVEVTRADLVAGFVGQTAQRTNAVCDQALGGVLFVDEAYSLVSGGQEDFGREALAELVKRMEDDRDRLVVILAGYRDEMETLIAANTGLRSRLQATLEFADYDAAELAAIFDRVVERDHWTLTAGARERAHAALAALHADRGADWANARTARSFYERCLAHQALRVTADGVVAGPDLDTIDEQDVPDGPGWATGPGR